MSAARAGRTAPRPMGQTALGRGLRCGTARPPGSLLATGRGLREVLDHARADLDQAFPDGRELALGERARLRDRGAHAMHQPERGGVADEPHLIGGRAVR